MATKKTVFVAFAIEDQRIRDLLKGQSLNTSTSFEYIDMGVTTAYESDWKTKVQTRIRRSDGVIALISKNSLAASGQKWEIECAKTEGKPILPMWIYSGDTTAMPGLSPKAWTWDTITKFIDSL